MSCGGCPSNQENVSEITERAPRKTGKTIFVTDSAAKFIRGVMEKQQKPGWGLRLEAVPGGCAGYKYYMGFQEKPADTDMTLESNGVKIILDKDSVELIHGSEVDYVESLEASGLKINNPNATRACGCGKSFG